MPVLRYRQLSTIVVAGLLVAAVVAWSSWRVGWLPLPPKLFALLVLALMAACSTALVLQILDLRRGRQTAARAMAAGCLMLGLLTATTGGFANWLFSLQGVVMLTELEGVPLSRTGHLQEFDAGPLSHVDEMRMTLQLEELNLARAPENSFLPVSRLRLAREALPLEIVEVAPGKSARVGSLVFHQGAFGFAPRIVIVKKGETVFDKFVPFTTGRSGSRGVAFQGEFTIEKEHLAVSGAVSLESLDERMKGHETLGLRVTRGGRLLGAGELLPGHFADLEDGYRIGFAGLKKWSEIDISRRNYPAPIFAGLGLLLLGTVLWPLAVWRGW